MPIGASIAIAGTGLGLSAFGQYKQGQAQQEAGVAAAKASESEAELADFNADVATRQAGDTLDRGNQQADQFRTQVRGAIGTQRTVQAASGVDVSSGSAVDVQADAAYVGKLDEMTLRANATRAAWGYTVNALNYRQQALIDRQKGAAQITAGDASATAGLIAGAGTLATGAGDMLIKKYGFGSKN